jgi:hypothetical protein
MIDYSIIPHSSVNDDNYEVEIVTPKGKARILIPVRILIPKDEEFTEGSYGLNLVFGGHYE